MRATSSRGRSRRERSKWASRRIVRSRRADSERQRLARARRIAAFNELGERLVLTVRRLSRFEPKPPFATVCIERFNLPPRSVKYMRQSSEISVINEQAEHHRRSRGPGSGGWCRTRRRCARREVQVWTERRAGAKDRGAEAACGPEPPQRREEFAAANRQATLIESKRR